MDNDLFVRPSPPPSADTLSWDYMVEDNGEEVFVDPNRVPLKDGGANVSEWMTDSRWASLELLAPNPLFETPVKHFFVKAFLEDHVDEFVAHMLTIEAALGLEGDYPRNGRPRPPKGATKLMADRVSALLEADSERKTYCDLFNLRSAFLHGRTMPTAISGEARLKARRLARNVVHKLVEAALKSAPPDNREAYLSTLAR